jgi:hypothetical protein
MPYWLQHSLAYSALFPCLVAIARYRQLCRRYLPFLLLMWLGLFNDQVSYLSGKFFRTNAPNSNLWFLTEFLLCLWFFYRRRLFRDSAVPRVIAAVYGLFWAGETFVYRSPLDFSVYAHILFAFTCVLLAIQYINKLIVNEQRLTTRHAEFLICIGLILYNTLALLAECFWLYGFDTDRQFAANVFAINAVGNFITNLIFGFALLWIPRKQAFLQLS